MVTWTCRTTFNVAAVTILVVPALIFWIVLMEKAIQAEIQCPKRCSCTETHLIDCSNISLNKLPPGINSDVKRLKLSHNNINILRKNNFVKYDLTELKILDLDNSNVISIEIGAFCGLPKLQHIHLNNNNISLLKTGVFYDLPNLDYLDISNNKIKRLFSGVFQVLSLQTLIIDNNEIENLTEDAFIGLDNLKYLGLSGNKLTHIGYDVFKYIPKLESLQLSNNKNLVVSARNPFLDLPTLRILSLSGCNITNVSATTFGMSVDLKHIDLDNNKLETLPIQILEMLPQLQTLGLSGNPLKCDCHLQKVWKSFHKHNIQDAYSESPKCLFPEEVSGLTWNILGTAQCHEEDIIFPYNNRTNVVEHESRFSVIDYHNNILKYLQLIIFSVLFLFGTVANMLVLAILVCNRRILSLPYAYVMNLAISDILILLTNFPFYYITMNSGQWDFGNFMCRFCMFWLKMSIGVNALSIAMLSIQRYCATSGSLCLSSKHGTMTTIALVWFTASCCALPSALSVHVEHGYCSILSSSLFYELVAVFDLLVFCTIPLIVIVFTYVMMARQLACRAQHGTESRTHRTLAKIVIALAVVFFFTFVPYHCFKAFHFHLQFGLHLLYLNFISQCLLLMNSSFNPVALYCTSDVFKKLFQNYLSCSHKPSGDYELFDLPEGKGSGLIYVREATETDVL